MKREAMAALLVATISLAGCTTPYGERDNTATGAVTGGAVGAATGAIIGGAHGRAGPGALIGGAAGVIAGGLIGHSMDREQAERLRREAPATYTRVDNGNPITVADVKALARAGVGDDVIISQIESTRTVFYLSTADILDLKNSGVSERVIDVMINTPRTFGVSTAEMVYEAPPPPQTEVVGPAPTVGWVWIGGEWIWHDHWVWSPGHWARPPRSNFIWVPGRWQHGPRGFDHVPGHWIRH